MITQILESFWRLPLWVRIWVALILMPVNFLSVLFIDQPNGLWISGLAIGGMLPNLFILAYDRGVSKLMSLPHVVIWTPLCVLVGLMLSAGGEASSLNSNYWFYLWVLLIINLISLSFDYPDILKWWRGDRKIA